MLILRRFVFLALLFVIVAAPSCATTGTPTTPVGAFGNCSTDALKTSSEGILGEVTSVLATGDWETQLTNLAVKYTSAEVGCAVDLVIAEFTKKAARTDDTETQVVLTHAKAFRAAHPAQ